MKRLAAALCLSALCLWADGHGPAFGFSTATLGAGDSSAGTAMMWRSGVVMLSPYFSYGITGNVQISISSPFHLNHGEHPVGRFTGLMPGDPEMEVLAAWRFHHSLTGIGTRNESTLYLGTSVSTQLPPRTDGPALRRAPGFYMAAATGHISRRYYVWAGAGYERYASLGVDHPSNSLLGSLVLGWRPAFLNKEDPASDCRFFWETTGEDVAHAWRSAAAPAGAGHHGVPAPLPTANSSGIIVLPNSGGRGVYSGPSLLYTHGNLAFQLGAQIAAWRDPNGIQPAERFRVVAGVSYFFLGRRR
ncbi:MAG TPA: hypothetical protein VMJ75_18145 [Candidatus Acidoferrales bacterium]|nr:hypothetical protein [Candidatus Acidoferrales bacterium]